MRSARPLHIHAYVPPRPVPHGPLLAKLRICQHPVKLCSFCPREETGNEETIHSIEEFFDLAGTVENTVQENAAIDGLVE